MPTAEHEITTMLDAEAIQQRLERIKAGQPLEAGQVKSEPRYFRPLVDAADEYIRFARSYGNRIYTGIPEFDVAMRGIAPGELMLVVGFAHSGKTVLVTEMVLHNHDKRIAWFTPDETRVLVLVKLASVVHGISAQDLEQRLANNDESAEDMLRSVALKSFPNLAVYDKSLDLRQMSTAMEELTDVWSAPPELVIFDYVDLLGGSGDDTASKINALKGWGKQHDVPFVVLHQSSRSGGKDGQEVTMTSGGYGGEQQATFMVGVRRKKNELRARRRELEQKLRTAKDREFIEVQIDEINYELQRHDNTVTFNLLKNKRPPSTLVDDVDYVLDRETGRIVHPEPVYDQENWGEF